ncbi:hypothetical protein AZ78_1079 [Lysobacter capsici AZ78]|uniref:Uncharacterized protein n=1 Tax=Lysobacter capsici AZ78 TaxID=1444315 RepID=A0A125MMI6_9GAMM|nr:hypothetical protein AZ78_1079 [Lysobacter capsici AZ78]
MKHRAVRDPHWRIRRRYGSRGDERIVAALGKLARIVP